MSDRLADDAHGLRRSTADVLRAIPAPAMVVGKTTLADKYDLAKDRVFVSGAQAIVRLLLMQRAIDAHAGHRTAGFVSGYRGSPLGRIDTNMLGAKAELGAADIRFEPGLNEDLAATAIWGAQQAEMRGEGKYDGVFALWYGKGPGVDRSADALRHANLAGTSALGGVLALMGDDHFAESSSTAHQSEFIFADMMMPILAPAGVQELVDYGLMGFAMSRYTGTWTGLKCVKETIEATASIEAPVSRAAPVTPSDLVLPPGGLNIRPRDGVIDQDERLTRHKFAAILAFLRANKLNRVVLSGGGKARLGIVASGKAYLDVRQALDRLGIDEVAANAFGLRVLKLACPWPVEPSDLRGFAAGLETIMVVEEKRPLIEAQVRELLYDAPHRPACIGKKDEDGAPLFPSHLPLDSTEIAIAIGRRLLARRADAGLAARVEALQGLSAAGTIAEIASRTPTFCSGCPHNSSTRIPEGARAYAGIGCHFMVQTMDRATEGYTQMGGEGANWIGEAPFSTRDHVFQNLGDGTYNHSGTLAIRWAVAAKTDITYKILFNDAVAMTGGQSHEGGLTVDRIAAQCAAEGVAAIAIVADDPKKYPKTVIWPAGTTIHAREDLDGVQRDLAGRRGVSILVFDQTCAAETRRRRKKGLVPDPDIRVVINEAVCEGCGDCGTASNCVALQPIDTEFGRKRTIDQTSCNKDLTCLTASCPAIVTVSGAPLRQAAPASSDGLRALPPRVVPEPLSAKPFSIIVAGVGGTGIVTIGAILGMAAHLEGKGCGILDMAGLAQKGGVVFSHVRLAERPADIAALRVTAGEADLVLGCDLVAAGARKVLGAIRKGSDKPAKGRPGTGVVVNTAALFPGEFARDATYDLPTARLRKALRQASGDSARFLDATKAANVLLGSSLAANMLMLGYAWQHGLVPLAESSILRAITLNGEAVAMNREAFAWGRRAAVFPADVDALVAGATRRGDVATSLDEIVAVRAKALTAYQNAAYAERYRSLVERARAAEACHAPGGTQLTEAVARAFHKLLAVKDEYEVARLYSDGGFARQLADTFGGKPRVTFHLAPPILVRRDAKGAARKMAFGPWMARALPVLAHGKRLRATPFDVFGYSKERRQERRLAADYEVLMAELFLGLSPENHATAVALATLPETIRGFGPVKENNRAKAALEQDRLLADWRAMPAIRMAAE